MIVKRDVVIRKMMVSQNEGFYFPQDEKNVIETTITIISPMVGAMQNYLWAFFICQYSRENKMERKLKLYGFNNLTKSLSFNIYDVCYAKTAREQRD